MYDKRKRGISLIEVLVAAGIFTIVILGITQTVLLMHRYARANLCKYKAHLIATSYFESLLCDTHPYDLNQQKVSLRYIDAPATTFNFKYDTDTYQQTSGTYRNLNTFTTSVYNDGNDDLKVFILLKVEESPLCKVYKIDEDEPDSIANSKARVDINPPEGFQSLRLTYWYTSPFMNTHAAEGSIAYLDGLEWGELYAIRALTPDDPEYDV